jgi:Ca2+-dependent lipid-binding protein
MTHSLKITVHEATHLEDVERFGKNDPYARVSLDIADNKHFQKTKTIKNAGKEAAWNQTLTLENFDPHTHEYLYVEILDEESLADDPIAYAAIPLSQVTQAQGHAIKGRFNLFTVKDKEKGEILLTIAAVAPGATEAHHPAAMPNNAQKNPVLGNALA